MIKNKPHKLELALFLIAAIIAGAGVYFLGPSITGFVVKEFSYSKDLNLVVTSNGNYTLELDNIGELKSLKLDGRVTSYGKARAYIESSGIRYLVFDSTKLEDDESKTISNESNLITGFAAKETDENKNESDKAKKEKNKKPKWTGEDKFVVNGTIEINLSKYFVDEDGDALTYSVSEADGFDVSIDGEIVAIEPETEKNINATITFIASDGIGSKSHTVSLLVIVEKANVVENKPPKWNSGTSSFVVNGTTTIDLSKYFIDEDGDSLLYNYGAVSGITISIENAAMTAVPADNFFGNVSTIFTSFDGRNLTIQSVLLIVPEKAVANITTNETNQTINQTPIIGETKTITINLSYNSGTVFDANDNGEESVNGVVDLSVAGTKFGWDADSSKLCTRWEVYSAEEESLTTFCNGNNDCCAFVELLPTKSNWSEVYYSSYGKDNAGHGNIVSAQVLYYDVNLSIDNPKSEIYISDFGNLSVKFFEEETEFFDECIETCSLSGFNKSSITLFFEIEDDAILRINKIKYSILTDVVNNPPVLTKNISTINISKNRNATINLSQYFADEDGDELGYGYYKAGNISVFFEGSMATIVPDKGIEDIRYMYFTANDSELAAVSNLFMLNITQEKFKPKVEIGKPVKWQQKILVDVKNASSVNFTLPESASNISIKILNESIEKELPDDNIKIIDNGEVKGKKEFELEKRIENTNRKISILEEAKLKGVLKVAVDSGEFEKSEIDLKLNELYNEKSQLEQQLSSINLIAITGNLITANVIALTEASVETESAQPILLINETLTKNIEITIEYETEAPVSIEEELSAYTKQIKIVSETSYEDVLSYTTVNDVPETAIKLYWIVNDTKILFDNVDYLDENSNGLVDRIEWVVPHLSNQTFEVSITVLNVQSYPTVGGNWTVAFNTTGTGNLSIYAYNGTSYAEKENDSSNTLSDLDVLELRCENNVLEPYYIADLGELELSGIGISGNVVKEIEEEKNIKESLRFSHSEISDPSSSTVNSLPLNSLTSDKSRDKDSTSLCGLGGWIMKTTMPKNSFGGNIDLLRKSESREINTNSLSLENDASLPLASPFEAYSAENCFDSRNSFTALGMFSSSRNFGEFDIMLSADELGSIFESGRNMLSGDGWVVLQNNLYRLSGRYQLDNIANQNSGALESGLSVADFAVRDDVLVDFDSHNIDTGNALFKGFGENSINPEKEEKQAHSLDKSTSLAKGNFYEFALHSENYRGTRTLGNTDANDYSKVSVSRDNTITKNSLNFENIINEKEKRDSRNSKLESGTLTFTRLNDYYPYGYLNVSILHFNNHLLGRAEVPEQVDGSVSKTEAFTRGVGVRTLRDEIPLLGAQNSITQKYNNQNYDKITSFFTIIPSAYALHSGSSTYPTISINGKVYALLTKEQVAGHSYTVFGVYYPNYNCDNQTGYWTVQVLTSGVHNQRFNFSSQIADAHNLATVSGATSNGSIFLFIDDSDVDFNDGTLLNVSVNGTGLGANLTLNKNSTNQYPNQTGNFTSHVFNANKTVNWTFIAWGTELPYQTEIGRATGDANNVALPYVNTSGLVGLWHFNNETGENDSLFKDFSIDVNTERAGGKRNNATCSGSNCPAYGSFKFGGARDFERGTPTRIRASDDASLDIGGSFTITAWVKTETLAFGQAIVEKGATNYAVGTSGDEMYAKAGDASTTTSGSINLQNNRIYFLAWVFDDPADLISFYVDGVLGETGAEAGTATTNTGVLAIGADSGGGGDAFDGLIDEVAIWNRSLRADEISNIYKRGVLSLNISVRSCDDSACSGEAFSGALLNNSGMKLNTSITPNNRFFQYRAIFNTQDVNYTPTLHNVSINYSLITNLTIWDDTDTITKVLGKPIRFYANFTDGKDSINASSNVNCTFSENSTGWGTAVNMSFNSTLGIYYLDRQFGTENPNGTNYFNVSCDAVSLGYNVVNTIDAFTVYPSLNISLNLNVTTTSASQPIAVTGHINLSNSSNVSNNRIYAFINEAMLNITSGFGGGSNITDTSQDDFTSGINNLTNATRSPGNVTLANDTSATTIRSYFPRGNFTSRIFNTTQLVNWTNISFATEVPYQRDYEDLKNNSVRIMMHFDNKTGENDTFALDTSENGVNGTIIHAPYVDGRFGYGLEGGNASRIVNLSDLRDRIWINDSRGTFEAWIKQGKADGSYQAIFSVSGADSSRFYVRIGSGNVLALEISGGDNIISGNGVWTGGTVLKGGLWYHIAARYDGINHTLFVNGMPEAVTQDAIAPNGVGWLNGSTFRGKVIGTILGRTLSVTNVENPFNGTVDELVLWNVSLDNATIMQHALRGFGNLSLQARACAQSDCSDNPSFQGPNGTATYFTNMSAVNYLNASNFRYLQYRAYLSTNNTNLTPVLMEVNVSYDGLFTDSFGNYNFSNCICIIPNS